jgi:hypothetical protein
MAKGRPIHAMNRCANCGCPDIRIQGGCLADGEGVCSNECYDQHEEEGCPLERGSQYRKCPHPRTEIT